MKFWWFQFEGWFSEESEEYSGEGVFSECLVQADEYIDADLRFLQALAKRKINLIEVSEYYLVDTDPSQMDPDNKDNGFWFKWCQQTEIAGEPTFEVFHLYPTEEVEVLRFQGN